MAEQFCITKTDSGIVEGIFHGQNIVYYSSMIRDTVTESYMATLNDSLGWVYFRNETLDLTRSKRMLVHNSSIAVSDKFGLMNLNCYRLISAMLDNTADYLLIKNLNHIGITIRQSSTAEVDKVIIARDISEKIDSMHWLDSMCFYYAGHVYIPADPTGMFLRKPCGDGMSHLTYEHVTQHDFHWIDYYDIYHAETGEWKERQKIDKILAGIR